MLVAHHRVVSVPLVRKRVCQQGVQIGLVQWSARLDPGWVWWARKLPPVSGFGSGQTLSDPASELGISGQTARVYLKQVFQKAGAKQQAELVWRIQDSIAANR